MQKNSMFVDDLISTREVVTLSQDGTLGRAATQGYNTPKTYLVEVEEFIMDSHIRTLNGPVSFAGEIIVPMRVRKLAPRLLEFVLREGKNRQIRVFVSTRACGLLIC